MPMSQPGEARLYVSLPEVLSVCYSFLTSFIKYLLFEKVTRFKMEKECNAI